MEDKRNDTKVAVTKTVISAPSKLKVLETAWFRHVAEAEELGSLLSADPVLPPFPVSKNEAVYTHLI
jgi:hypothetical protein